MALPEPVKQGLELPRDHGLRFQYLSMMMSLSSVLKNPFQTRQALRQRFSVNLGAADSSVAKSVSALSLTDEEVLTFLQTVTFEFGNSTEHMRAFAAQHGSVRAFETAIAGGWARLAWGRVHISFDLARAAQGASLLEPSLLGERFGLTVSMPDGHAPPSALLSTNGEVEDGWGVLRRIRCTAPEWVAARLWDRFDFGPLAPNERLRWWYDRWNALSWPRLVPARIWSEADAATFRAAILDVAATEGFLGWDEFHAYTMTIAVNTNTGVANSPPPRKLSRVGGYGLAPDQ